MYSRRNSLIVLFLLLLLAGCTKDMPVFIPLGLHDGVPGTWAYAHDANRSMRVHTWQGSEVVITFPQQLASPVKGPADITYTTGYQADTLVLTSGNIYPGARFWLYRGNVYGLLQETANAPGQGSFKPILKTGR